jgi:hypothetical protein
MAVAARSRRVSVEESVHELAGEFRDGARSFSVQMAAELHRSIPELGGHDPNALDDRLGDEILAGETGQ